MEFSAFQGRLFDLQNPHQVKHLTTHDNCATEPRNRESQILKKTFAFRTAKSTNFSHSSLFSRHCSHHVQAMFCRAMTNILEGYMFIAAAHLCFLGLHKLIQNATFQVKLHVKVTSLTQKHFPIFHEQVKRFTGSEII